MRRNHLWLYTPDNDSPELACSPDPVLIALRISLNIFASSGKIWPSIILASNFSALSCCVSHISPGQWISRQFSEWNENNNAENLTNRHQWLRTWLPPRFWDFNFVCPNTSPSAGHDEINYQSGYGNYNQSSNIQCYLKNRNWKNRT